MNEEERKYEVRVLLENYKDIQEIRKGLGNRITCFLRDYIAPKITKSRDIYILPKDMKYLEWNDEILQMLHKKKFMKVTELISNVKIRCPREIANLVWSYNRHMELEKETYDKLDAFSKEHPFRRLYLNNIKGIGAIACTGILAWLAPLSRFNTPSKLWKYAGWGMEKFCTNCNKIYLEAESRQRWEEILTNQNKDPKKYICYCNEPELTTMVQKKRKGVLMTFSPQIKSSFYVIAENFIRNKNRGSYYGRMYDEYKWEARAKYKDWNDGHIRSYAIRKMVREFLTHIWMAWWYIMEKQNPPTSIYAKDILKHSDISYPVVDVVDPPIRIKSPDDVDMLWEISKPL